MPHPKSQVMVYRIFLSILSAFFLILSYPKFNLVFLAWIAFIPLFIALEHTNVKERLIIGYLFGVFFFSGVLYWLTNVSILGTVILVLFLSLGPAFFCALHSLAINHKPLDALFIPSIWVLIEYIYTYIFTGFPWALLGYSQYLNLPFIQISDITGPYGVSFIIILVNFCIYSFIKKFPKKEEYGLVTLILVVSAFIYGIFKLNEDYVCPSLVASVVQGNIPQEMKWDENYKKFILDKYETLTYKAIKNRPDIVIWPETSVPGILEKEVNIYKTAAGIAKFIKTNLLVGTVRKEGAIFYNSASLLSKDGDILDSYDKMHLVPFGEYIPLEKYMPKFRNMIDKTIGDFSPGAAYKLFKISVEYVSVLGNERFRDIKFFTFGTLICYEDIFPAISRNFVKEGAEFIVNITNDAWFGDSSAPYQHLQSSVFRAVENRVPFIQCANTGISCFINQKGRITDIVWKDGKETYVDGYKDKKIYPLRRITFYNRFGDMFCLLCFILFIICIIEHKLAYDKIKL